MIIYLPIFDLSHGVINKGCVGWVQMARVKGALASSALVQKQIIRHILPSQRKRSDVFFKKKSTGSRPTARLKVFEHNLEVSLTDFK